MATKSAQVSVEQREPGGSVARRLRREGKVPAVVYGGGKPPVSIALDVKTLDRAVHGPSRVIQLKGRGVTGAVMVRAYDFDPLSGHVRHVDFQRIEEGKVMHTTVAVAMLDEAILLKKGLIASWNLDEVEVEALPAALPELVEIEVGNLTAGDSITAGQLDLPSGVKLLTDPEDIVLSIVAPSVAGREEEKEAEQPEEDEGASA